MRHMQIPPHLPLLEEQDKRLRIWYTLELMLLRRVLGKRWATH